MNFFERIIFAISGEMTRPTPYGWFHLLSIMLMIIFAILIFIFLRDTNEKQNRIILITYASVCLGLELYKQLVFSYDGVTDVWKYQWYAFPFQFCSTPMYVALVAAFVKKGKVQNSLYAFLAVYGLTAGLAVMISPGDVFIETIGINIQTMIHHGGQVLIGLYLIACNRVKINYKTPIVALPTFLSLMAIALLLNVTLVNFTNGATFNMFFISPYFPSTLPVFDVLYHEVHYIIFLLLYIIAFLIGAYIITFAIIGIKKLIDFIKVKVIKKKVQVKDLF